MADQNPDIRKVPPFALKAVAAHLIAEAGDPYKDTEVGELSNEKSRLRIAAALAVRQAAGRLIDLADAIAASQLPEGDAPSFDPT